MSGGPWRRFFLMAGFEGSLFFVALLLAKVSSLALSARFPQTPRHWLATAALIGLLCFAFVVSSRSSWPPLAGIRDVLGRLVRPLFEGLGVFRIAALCAFAGLGEEALFRGWLQPWLARGSNELVALAISSVIFGAAHALTTAYFAAATLIGASLGALALFTRGWLAPAVAHALYDFFALLWFLRSAR
jgi:uncharacterized protein